MLKVTDGQLDKMDERYPGVREQVLNLEATQLPACEHCQSEDTAEVNVGLVGQSIAISAATSKFRLLPNGPKPGTFFCNACEEYFG